MTEAKKFRKKLVVIDALQWDGSNHRDMFDFLTGNKKKHEYMNTNGKTYYIDLAKVEGGLIIKTLEGEYTASIGDWIIKGISGEFYPCKPDIFELTYNSVK